MHERSLVNALLGQVEALQRRERAVRVLAVYVSVGVFSGVEPDLFGLAFEEAVASSPLQGARLKLQQVPLEARCDWCSREFLVERFRFQCPDCECDRVTVIRGEELMLDKVTMESVES